MAALVVDVGALLDEKRQLQNGADAGALAVAQQLRPRRLRRRGLAESLADANSRDGDEQRRRGHLPRGQPGAGDDSTQGGGGSILPYCFGQVLTGEKGRTVQATATATWAARSGDGRRRPARHLRVRGGRSSWSGPTRSILFHQAHRDAASAR